MFYVYIYLFLYIVYECCLREYAAIELHICVICIYISLMNVLDICVLYIAVKCLYYTYVLYICFTHTFT